YRPRGLADPGILLPGGRAGSLSPAPGRQPRAAPPTLALRPPRAARRQPRPRHRRPAAAAGDDLPQAPSRAALHRPPERLAQSARAGGDMGRLPDRPRQPSGGGGGGTAP